MELNKKLKIQERINKKLNLEKQNLEERVIVLEAKTADVEERYDAAIQEAQKTKQMFDDMVSEMKKMMAEYHSLQQIKKILTE